MGLHVASPALLTVLLALIAGTQANTLYVFDFNSDLQGWASQRGSWRWADSSTLQNTIPNDYQGGFAVMDAQFDSDELYTPYFRAPRGGNFTMRFYVRSKYVQSNDFRVYTRNKLNVDKDFIDLKEYSLDDTSYWSITQKELPPDDKEVRFEIFCYNGEAAQAGEPLLGCGIDQITFEVYDDNTTPAPTTTEEPTDPPTDPPTTTEEPTDPPTDPPTTTEEPTDPPTDPPTTTEEPTDPPTDPPTTTEEPTDPPTDPPTTTEEPTDPPTDPPTTTDEPTDPPTDPPTTTEEPTDPPTTTDEPTDPPTDPPTTTEEPTDPPTDPPTTTDEPTDPPTDSPTTTEEPTETPTDSPDTTEEPTDPPTDSPTTTEEPTETPTDSPDTTAEPTDPPTDSPTTTEEPTETPTDSPTTTEEPTETPTDSPDTTAEPTDPPTDSPTTTEEPTDPPTDSPTTTEEPTETPTDSPDTTAEPTDPPTDSPTTTEEPTDPPTDSPTTTEEPTETPTDSPDTTAEPTDPPTDPPTTTEDPIPSSTTTEGPAGPIFFDFEDDMNGWSLVHMNYASFKRVKFDHDHYGVKPPPSGSMVLQVFADHVQSGTVVAKSPMFKATEDLMTVRVTFWMNGTNSFPAQLKVRRQFSYDTFEESPVMNLDSFGDQTNRVWIAYTTSKSLAIGEEFSLFMEASLGGDNFNEVAVSSIQVSGVQIVDGNDSTLFDFEGGLEGWVPGKMDGGIWELTTWDKLDPSLNIPKPEAGEKFLIASRSNIYSGVISIESPIMEASNGMTQRLTFSFYLRGSFTYPVVLRIRMKTPDGTYAALPFIDLREYGNTDYQQWLQLDHEIEIPLGPNNTQYQLVIEVDLGSWMSNVVALDDFTITNHSR